MLGLLDTVVSSDCKREEAAEVPSASGKHRVEIPESLWEALDEAAQRSEQPTAVLIAKWLWEALEAKARTPGHAAEGLHAPQPYDRGWREYPRRG